MQQTLIHRLIGRVLSGEASAIEERELARWLERSPGNREIFDAIKDGWDDSKTDIVYARSDAVYNKIHDRIRAEERPVNKEIDIHRNRRQRWHQYAATIAIFVATFLIVLWFANRNAVDQIVSAAVTVKSTPPGSKLKFYLPDGSTVWLNAKSRLEFPEDFTSDHRLVQLEGEAFFEVVSDSLRPFIVKTGSLNIRVLGTSFNVKAVPRFNDIRVSVLTGRVEVFSAKDSAKNENRVVLLPSHMAVYQKANDNLIARSCNITSEVCWKDGIILFEDAGVDHVVRELEQWYGVDFILDSNLDIDHGINARFDNKSLEYVLNGLRYISSINYRIEDKKVYLFNE